MTCHLSITIYIYIADTSRAHGPISSYTFSILTDNLEITEIPDILVRNTLNQYLIRV